MTRKDFTSKLFSLGCAYSLSHKPAPPDLENTILDGLQFYWKSNDLFFMLYGLLVHRVGHLVHTERLVILAKKRNLEGDHLTLLLCLSQKLMDQGYGSFESVIRKLSVKGLKFKSLPESETNSFLIERWGVDPIFKTFGGEVRTLPLEDSKKFFLLERVFKENPWLALRALVGANNRADILYVKTQGIVPTANQASKYLSCSVDAAYRYWNAAKDIKRIKLSIKTESDL